MIQRIQSIYLLLATVAVGLVFAFPFGTLTGETVFNYTALSITSETGAESFATFPVGALAGLSALLTFVSIFLFKNRSLQNRLNVLAMLLMVCIPAVAYGYAMLGAEKFATQGMTYSVAYVLPVCGAILTFLAFKAIRKDDNLVRSLDRIR